MSTKTKVKKVARRSMKGKWGNVGAPPKTTKWPKGPFAMTKLFNMNDKGGNAQCELSLRNKVEAGLVDGTILALVSKKQPGGKVGRPKSMFIRKEDYVPGKHELAAQAKPVTVAVVPASPAVAPAPLAPEIAALEVPEPPMVG